jgi:hypothetical protein
MWKAQKLVLGSDYSGPRARGAVIGRVYANVMAKPTRRRAKAEMIALRARADWQNADTIVRVR